MSNVIFTEDKANEIFALCETIESFTAIVKAEMNAFRGGVGTAPKKRKRITKADKIAIKKAEARAKFNRK